MKATLVSRHDLPRAWPHLWPLLEPAVRRSADVPAPRPLARLIAGEAQLWAVVEAGRPIAAVVTQITLQPETRCLVWLVGGRRLRDWAPFFVARLEAWARGWGCVSIWGAGRPGWARLVAAMGGVRIADVDGQPAWERRMA
ncbi:hypothetical protein [Reyranella sp.]|uniref:hypothetical protein n=1 Tax=Reyranella sp. TaxID=1929291 RepID=UPI003BAC0B1B